MQVATPTSGPLPERSAPPAKPAPGLTPRRRGAEAYDTLLWRLQPRMEGRLGGAFLVGVTSCVPRAGVSTVATNLAVRAADNRVRPTLVIDANTESPRLDRTFRLRKQKGFAELLAGGCSLEEATHATGVEGLEAMPLGSAELIDRVGLDHRLIDAMVETLRETYDLVVFDLPPAPRLRHNLLVARRLDGVLLAVRNEATQARQIQSTVEALRADEVELIGSVMTRQKHYTPKWLRRLF